MPRLPALLLSCLAALAAPALGGASDFAPAPGDTRRLDINIAVFDPGLEAGAREGGGAEVFPEIRELESRYVPFALRDALAASDRWGAVRVLPAAKPESELLITGRIRHSDGARMVVAVRAVDSSGLQWLDGSYSSTAGDSPPTAAGAQRERPFAALCQRIASELLAFAQSLGERRLAALEQIAQLRYARSLAPAAFASHLERTAEGRFELRRLPAADDPMLRRIGKVREYEYVFADTVDEQYASLFRELGPVYELWRRASREQALYRRLHANRLAERGQPRRGSYESMKRAYLNFRWKKTQEQESMRLAEGFDNETRPTLLELEGRVVELNGDFESQYLEWRRILREIWELEQGV